MALHRGIQSAIFYYVSCAPCAEVRVRKRRKQDAERDRAEREALEAHMPGLYRQPDPSSTNPYWQQEIEAGPIPMRTKKRLAESSKAGSSTRSNIASSVSVDASAMSMERSDSAKSGLDKFQRQDEKLWGARTLDGESLRPTSTRQSSSSALPRQPPRAKVNDVQSYQHMQNAAINDLHPPTTRKIHSREEVMWMMQPPPLPEVMNGKVPNRTTSNASRPSARSIVSRQARQTEVDEEAIQDDDSEEDTATPQTTSQEPIISAVHRSRTLPIRRPPDRAKASGIRKPPPSLQLTPPGNTRQASRPQLSTVLSESLVPASRHESENSEPLRTASFNSSLRQHNIPQHSDAQDFAPGTKSYKWMETRVLVPRRESEDHGSEGIASPENFDAWHSPEFELPQWIHEHTKREVRQRWSFDM